MYCASKIRWGNGRLNSVRTCSRDQSCRATVMLSTRAVDRATSLIMRFRSLSTRKGAILCLLPSPRIVAILSALRKELCAVGAFTPGPNPYGPTRSTAAPDNAHRDFRCAIRSHSGGLGWRARVSARHFPDFRSWIRGFAAQVCSPFSYFRFGVPETGSTWDRDRFAEKVSPVEEWERPASPGTWLMPRFAGAT